MDSLIRTRASVFGIEQSRKLSEIEQLREEDKISTILYPLDAMFQKLEAETVKEEFQRLLYNGNPLRKEFFEEEIPKESQIRVYDKEKHFIGIYTWDGKRNQYRPEKLFLPVEDEEL